MIVPPIQTFHDAADQVTAFCAEDLALPALGLHGLAEAGLADDAGEVAPMKAAVEGTIMTPARTSDRITRTVVYLPFERLPIPYDATWLPDHHQILDLDGGKIVVRRGP